MEEKFNFIKTGTWQKHETLFDLQAIKFYTLSWAKDKGVLEKDKSQED